MALGLGLGFGSGGGGFDPSDITEYKLDLNAEIGVTATGSLIDDWEDQSGSGNNGDSLTTGRPSTGRFLPNGKAAVDFQASDWLRVFDDVDFDYTTTGFTALVVVNFDTVDNNWRPVFVKNSGAGSRSWAMGSLSSSAGFHATYYSNGSTPNTLARDELPVAGTTYIMAIRYQGGGGKFEQMYGRTVAQTQFNTVTDFDDDAGNLYLGWAGEGASYFDGLVGRVLYYQKPLSDAELDQVGVYLADEYGASWATKSNTLLMTGASQSNDTLAFTTGGNYAQGGLDGFNAEAANYYGSWEALNTSTSGYPLREANDSPPTSYGYITDAGGAGVAYDSYYQSNLESSVVGKSVWGGQLNVDYVRLHGCEGDVTDSKANIKGAMTDLIDLLVVEHGSQVKGLAYVSPTYAFGVTDAQWQDLKEARIEAVAEHANGISAALQFETYHLSRDDEQHLTDASLELVFEDFVKLAAHLDGKTTAIVEPSVVSASYSGDEVTITLSEDVTGTEFGHFRVEDDGVAATVSSMGIVDNVLTLTLSASITAGSTVELWVNYGKGDSWTLANLPLSATGRPIKTIYDYSVTEA